MQKMQRSETVKNRPLESMTPSRARNYLLSSCDVIINFLYQLSRLT